MATCQEMCDALSALRIIPPIDTTSYPFVVQLPNGDKVVVDFRCEVSGVDIDNLFAHISEIKVCDSELHVSQFPVVLDIPAKLYMEEQYSPPAYLAELEDIYNNFSQEKMDALMQKGSNKILFNAYRAATQYVRACYKGV